MSGNINFNGWLNDDGSENYKCRAWVNFNGTATVAIRASGNVSSVTDNGTSDYTVNFTTPMPNANYSAVWSVAYSTAAGFKTYSYDSELGGQSQLAGSVRLSQVMVTDGGSSIDPQSLCLAVFA